MNVLFDAVYILVSFFKMPFHCANKTISFEISMSGDNLRLEGNKGWKICPARGDFTNRIYPGVGNLTKNCPEGARI